MRTALKAMAAATLIAFPVAGANAGDAKQSILDKAAEAGNYTTLVKAVKAAGLKETLSGEGPFTLFAPTDAAFGKLPADELERLMQPENKDELKRILTFHVVPGKVMSSDIAGKSTEADTVEGQKLAIDATGDAVKVGDAVVTSADMTAWNGVIHGINAVLAPQDEAAPAQSGS